ncbi:MAG: hypothetical protein KDG50_03300 [Chromatiales bacterium]|nr:hypothetical protein [Chromatiales bacterium]
MRPHVMAGRRLRVALAWNNFQRADRLAILRRWRAIDPAARARIPVLYFVHARLISALPNPKESKPNTEERCA